MKILIPSTTPEAPTPRAGVNFVTYEPLEQIPAEHRDADALVVWGNTRAQLGHCSDSLENLRWVQTLSAGAEAVLSAGFTDDVVITNGRGLHDGPVSEHALALLLGITRRLDLMAAAQHKHVWDELLGGLQQPGQFPGLGSLSGRRVAIWGFGSIGQTLAPLLSALGATVTGIATSPGDRGGFPVIASSDIRGLLPQVDVLIGILPAAESTHRVIGRTVFEALPSHAWVINVGRGSTLDEDALIAALGAGEIQGAALDVTEVEPLPKDSQLWGVENLFITPHAAGGRPVGVAAFLDRNIAAFLAGEELINQVSS